MLTLFRNITKITENTEQTRDIKEFFSSVSSLHDSSNRYGESRHYAPATKEWINSVYSFDKNYSKTIPIADSVVNRLIKSYFNLSPLFGKKKSKRVQIRLKRLSLNKILVSKAEMKHSNDKVIVTVYLYNKNKLFLSHKLKKLYYTLFPTLKETIYNLSAERPNLVIGNISEPSSEENKKRKKKINNPSKPAKQAVLTNNYLNNLLIKIKKNKLAAYIEAKKTANVKTRKKNKKSSIKTGLDFFSRKKINPAKKAQQNIMPLNKVNSSALRVKSITLNSIKLIKKVRKYKNFIIKLLKWNNKSFTDYESKYYNKFMKKVYKKELLYTYYMKMLFFNNNKFKNWFLLGLKKVLSRIYKKKIEFNFVNLKYLHLNSDIFSESIAIKLKNRQNRLLSVLKKALNLVKLSRINRKSYNPAPMAYNLTSASLHNKNKPSQLLENSSGDTDKLNLLLYSAFHDSLSGSGVLSEHNSIKKSEVSHATSLNNTQINVLDSIKHKSVFGVRLEAAGRLSKRLTASRSVFKLKYKGSLKNIDSSQKGLSSVTLRGNMKPNLQYTNISSKTRNGAFGLKGWVSGY